MPRGFRIKICGVRCGQDVQAVAEAGGDAIGINFYPPSVRYQNPKDPATKTIVEAARKAGIRAVGVFVNEPIEPLSQLAADIGLDAIQLHGDEPIEVARQLVQQGWEVIRAIRLPVGPLDPDQLQQQSAIWIEAGVSLLIDADGGTAVGGSGQQLDWQSLHRWETDQTAQGAHWMLAGGLNPENVSQAIRQAGPYGVDVASGVESPRGVKSLQRIKEFCQAAQAAWPK